VKRLEAEPEVRGVLVVQAHIPRSVGAHEDSDVGDYCDRHEDDGSKRMADRGDAALTILSRKVGELVGAYSAAQWRSPHWRSAEEIYTRSPRRDRGRQQNCTHP